MRIFSSAENCRRVARRMSFHDLFRRFLAATSRPSPIFGATLDDIALWRNVDGEQDIAL
jgi:hypothetical protein